MCKPQHNGFVALFEATVGQLVRVHPKYRPIKVGLVAQYLVDVTFRLSVEESTDLLDKILIAHEAACKTEQWSKQGGRYAESLHGWIARRGWEDVLPEAATPDKELEELRAAGERYVQEKRAR